MAIVGELAVVKFKSTNGNIDDCTHRFAYTRDPAVTSLAQIYTDIEAFYTTTYAGVSTMGGYLHPAMDRTANQSTITSYDITAHLAGSPFGAPVGGTAFTLPAADTGGGVAPALAAVLEYNASLAGVVEFGPGTRPRSRRRGRIYFGPLDNQAIVNQTSAPWDTTLSTNFTNVAKAAMTALLASTHFGPGWCVWSRKDAALWAVVGGWLDSTIHVQRRRQDPSGVKTLWP